MVDAAAAGRHRLADRLDAHGDRADEPSRAPPVTPPSPTRPCRSATTRSAETGGPAGYTPSAWSCVGGTSGTDTVTLAPGDAATCTITNTAIAPTLTLVKVVDNGTTGATTPATAWTLSATGPVSISGATGSAAVTARRSRSASTR